MGLSSSQTSRRRSWGGRDEGEILLSASQNNNAKWIDPTIATVAQETVSAVCCQREQVFMHSQFRIGCIFQAALKYETPVKLRRRKRQGRDRKPAAENDAAVEAHSADLLSQKANQLGRRACIQIGSDHFGSFSIYDATAAAHQWRSM